MQVVHEISCRGLYYTRGHMCMRCHITYGCALVCADA